MGARQDVDRIDLHDAQAFDETPQGTFVVGRCGARLPEALRCKGDAPCLGGGERVLDVGSGAGLPGIPLALLRPDLQLTLIEPLLRRSTFLTQTVDELGLGPRVQVVRSRAEDHHQTYDVVVSRALAPLDRLIGWCNPLRSPGGIILALKGSSAANEVKAAETELRATHLNAEIVQARAHPAAEPATVVRLTPRRTPKR